MEGEVKENISTNSSLNFVVLFLCLFFCFSVDTDGDVFSWNTDS